MFLTTISLQEEFTIEGLLGITLDNQDVFLVSINETIRYEEEEDEEDSPPRPIHRRTLRGGQFQQTIPNVSTRVSQVQSLYTTQPVQTNNTQHLSQGVTGTITLHYTASFNKQYPTSLSGCHRYNHFTLHSQFQQTIPNIFLRVSQVQSLYTTQPVSTNNTQHLSQGVTGTITLHYTASFNKQYPTSFSGCHRYNHFTLHSQFQQTTPNISLRVS